MNLPSKLLFLIRLKNSSKIYYSEKTKKTLSEFIGIPYEQLVDMEDDEIKEYVGLPIQTMEEVDKGLDRIINKKDDD